MDALSSAELAQMALPMMPTSGQPITLLISSPPHRRLRKNKLQITLWVCTFLLFGIANYL